MTAPIWFYSATLHETFGLDSALYSARVVVERREDAALTDADQVAIAAALAPHKAPSPPVPPAHEGAAPTVGVELPGAFGLDSARYQVTARIGRRDRQPLTATDTDTIRAALASVAIAAE
jgi:hypothetical protein